MSKKTLLALLWLVPLVAAFGLLHRDARLSHGDPDRFYHFALSRDMVASGQLFLRSVPQVEDLGWGELFVDKEFLFHQLTALGYRLGGDRGVEWAAALCALGSMLVFLLFAARHLPPSLAGAATVLTFTTPMLLARLFLLRPHLLAIFAFVLIQVAVLSRRPVATGLAVFFFTLSYHAFYIPLLCLGILFVVSFLEGREGALAWRRVVLFGAFGCLCGLLVNPYFPGNIDLAIIHAKIPGLIKGELADLNFGAEHTPLRGDVFVKVFFPPLAVLLAAFFLVGRDLRERSAEQKRRRTLVLYLLGVTLFFTALSFDTRRAGEYAVPAMGFLAVFLLKGLLDRPRAALAGTLAISAVGCVVFLTAFRTESLAQATQRELLTNAALAALPEHSRGKKVYNCEWDFTPYIYYKRPDLRFLDIMDPSLLYFGAKGPFRARDELRKGYLGDPHGMIRFAAKADYVLCNEAVVVEALRNDPGFRQIYPYGAGQASLFPVLFEVRPETPPQYARSFLVSQLGLHKGRHLPKLGHTEGVKPVELQRTTYLDLAAAIGTLPEPQPGTMLCGLAQVAPGEIAKHAGAEQLALGGGQAFELYRNGKPVYRTFPGFNDARTVQVQVPLSPPLAKGDRLEVIACSTPGAKFWGLTMSFWTKKELAETCAWKTEKTGPNNERARGVFAYSGSQKLNCLGPIAAPMEP